MKRLTSYSNNMLDYHVILDLLPSLATLYFSGRFAALDLKLSGIQSSILLALGLQRKVIEDIEAELKLPVSQALSLFVKVIRKITAVIEGIEKQEIDKTIPEDAGQQAPAVRNVKSNVAQEMHDELEEGGDEATKQLRAQQRDIIDSLELDKYAIPGNEDAGWQEVKDLNKVVSIKNPEKRKERDSAPISAKANGKDKAHKKQKRK
jgi:N-acetyltransferase 10